MAIDDSELERRRYEEMRRREEELRRQQQSKCPTCNGTGQEDEGTCGYRGPCRDCKGTGKARSEP